MRKIRIQLTHSGAIEMSSFKGMTQLRHSYTESGVKNFIIVLRKSFGRSQTIEFRSDSSMNGNTMSAESGFVPMEMSIGNLMMMA